MTENKRFMLDDAGELIDKETAQFIEYGEKVCDLLNEQHETVKGLLQKCSELTDVLIAEVEKNTDLFMEVNQLRIENMRLKELRK